MTQIEKDEIRRAVALAVEYWPNAHLGAYSRREDIRSAFKVIRRVAKQDGLQAAAGHLMSDAYRHMDM